VEEMTAKDLVTIVVEWFHQYPGGSFFVVRNTNIKKVIKKMSDFVKTRSDIFSGPFKKLNYNDEPKINIYSVTIKTKKPFFAENFTIGCGGGSFEPDNAILKTLGESIERYSLGVYKPKFFMSEGYGVVAKDNNIFPIEDILNTVSYPSKQKQYFNPSKKTKLKWTHSTEITSNKKAFVPAQLVYLPYVFNKEKIIRLPNSSGVALHSTKKKATISALYELIERDAFLLSYFLKDKITLIDINKSTKKIEWVKEYLEKYKLELYVVYTLTDMPLYTIASIIIDKTGVGPSVSIGLRAGVDLEKTILGAIEEAQYGRVGVRDFHSKQEKNVPTSKFYKPDSLNERALFWYPLNRIKKINFLISKKKTAYSIVKRNYNYEKNKETEYTYIINFLKKNGYKVFVTDITPKEVAEIGLSAVRVIMPDLQWLYLEESYKTINNKRINKFKKEMKNKRKKINSFPHPFL
jgi:ribosomal protein S12 methylthiotransferase accessory factor